MEKSILEKLIEIFGEENVLTEKTSEYSTDSWPKILFGPEKEKEKLAALVKTVVWPTNSKQISKLMELANKEKLTVIPYGGASGVCGGLIPQKESIMLNLQKMNQILQFNERNLMVTVEAGIFIKVLEETLEKMGYSLGHFPASIEIATIGGAIATRGSGQMSTKYGDIEDMILSLEVILPSGEIIKGPVGPRPFPGVKVLPLFVGTEGILGIITKATLKIMSLPKVRLFRVYNFSSIEMGLEAIREILKIGIKPATVRLYDGPDALFAGPGSKLTKPSRKKTEKESLKKKLMHAAEEKIFKNPRPINYLLEKTLKNNLLILVFEGEDEIIAKREMKLSQEICLKFQGEEKDEKLARIWYEERYKLNKEMLEKYAKRGIFVDTIDVAGSWTALPNVYFAVRNAIKDYALILAHFSHFYPQGGCIYFTFVGKGKTQKENLELYDKCWNLAMEKTVENNGVFTHHHGIGLVKLSGFLKQNRDEAELLKLLKKTLDPNNILNPGKLIN